MNQVLEGVKPPMEGRIPPAIFLSRLLRLCFYPVAAVVVGDLVLLAVPQAREALVAFGDDGRFWTQGTAFELAFLLWMISAWYVTRLLVGKRFDPDLIGRCHSARFAAQVTLWLPRALALAAGVPVALRVMSDPDVRWLGVMMLASSLIVFFALVFRRKVGKERRQKWLGSWRQHPGEDYEHFSDIAPSGRRFIGALAILSGAIWLAIPVCMESFTRPVGTPALLLFALMSWTIFGGFVLTYMPKARRGVGLTWLAILCVLVFFRFNENHWVTDSSEGAQNVPGAHGAIEPRSDVDVTFSRWLQQRPDPDAPVVLVATAGGASRAAYWTAAALGKLEDEVSPAGTFSANLFVISGISGGSLGAAAFVSSLREHWQHPTEGDMCHSVRFLGTSFTGRDHLATVTGMLLFPDLLQRLLPVPLRFWDRSRGLEEVWARDWERLEVECRDTTGAAANPWTRKFLQLHFDPPDKPWLPLLALNSTALNAGRPVLQADFKLFRSDAFDLLDGDFATGTLTLAEAVHNSARFPYISPGGSVKIWDKGRQAAGPFWDRLGDGGYVEASGTLTLTEIIRELYATHKIRPGNVHGTCSGVNPAKDPNCFVSEDQIKVLVLDNAPVDPPKWLCGANDTRKDGRRHNNPQSEPRPGNPWLPPIEDLTVPLDGAFSTRGGRAITSQVDLLELMDGCTERFAELRLPQPNERVTVPSMNWMLNQASRAQMDAALGAYGAHATSALVEENLERIHSWFAKPGSTTP